MDLKSLFRKVDDSGFLANSANVRRIPCGIAPFDVAMGGGLAQGRTMETYGPESSGKSTVALHLARSVQKLGGYVFALDGEFAYDDSRVSALKLLNEKTIVIHPDTLEDAFNIVDETCKKLIEAKEDIPVIYIMDSIASFPTQAERDGASGMAAQARVNSSRLRTTCSLVSKSGGLLLGINQLRDNVGVMFGDKTITPGGKAWRFYSSIRVSLKGVGVLKGEDVIPFGYKKYAEDQVGLVTEFYTAKNKTSAPHKRVYGVMFYETGYHSQLSLFETFRRLKLATSVGKIWRVNDTDISFTKREAVAVIKENTVRMKELLKDRFFGDKEDSNDAPTGTTPEENGVAEEEVIVPARKRKGNRKC